ncbi:hypothetical protein BJ546DRAFT_949304 [Cryomyces antarcticus]
MSVRCTNGGADTPMLSTHCAIRSPSSKKGVPQYWQNSDKRAFCELVQAEANVQSNRASEVDKPTKNLSSPCWPYAGVSVKMVATVMGRLDYPRTRRVSHRSTLACVTTIGRLKVMAWNCLRHQGRLLRVGDARYSTHAAFARPMKSESNSNLAQRREHIDAQPWALNYLDEHFSSPTRQRVPSMVSPQARWSGNAAGLT